MGNGKKLQSILKDRNVTIAALSRDTGISTNTLYALIKRDSNINTVALSKIADALHLSIDELNRLLTEDEDKTKNFELESISIDIDFDNCDIKELLRKINETTYSYHEKLKISNKIYQEIEEYTHKKYEIEKRLSKLQNEFELIKLDLKNKQLELQLLHSELSKKYAE